MHVDVIAIIFPDFSNEPKVRVDTIYAERAVDNMQCKQILGIGSLINIQFAVIHSNCDPEQ